ncbi:MAG TPA: polysaccharide deacetylase family protein [Solirubrobacter sp.]|nr:polysaccharide deacetylase family protein [Solirubrobacter sp.]
MTRVALTFEAGGDPAPARAMLAALEDAGVRATFFLDGRWAERHGDLVRALAAAGHELGNHGYDHPDWTTLDDDAIAGDLRATERVVRELTGGSVRPWARPPFGAIDDRVLALLDRLGYRAFYRDAVDGAHWPGETTAVSIQARALQAAADGDAVVMHTDRPETEAALPHVLTALRERGAEPVALSQLGRCPPPRAERHPDFAAADVRPGYVRPSAGGRWHSLNVLELGMARARPAGAAEPLVELGDTACDLVAGDAGPLSWSATEHDRRVLMLAGGVRVERDDGYLIARAGDLFLCPAGLGCRLTALDGRRWTGLVWRRA